MKIRIELDPAKEPLLAEVYLGAPQMFEVLTTLYELIDRIDRDTNPIWIADQIYESIKENPHFSRAFSQMIGDEADDN